MVVLFSNLATALYEGECWTYINGTVCFNGTQSYVQLTGAKLNWSDILNPQTGSGSSDGNNYTTSISFSNLGNTSTLTLGRNGMSSLTATLNYPFVSCSSGEYSRWNGSAFLCFNDGGDGNNYPTSLTFSGRTLTLGRNGLSDLTSNLIDNSTLVSCSNITGSVSNLCTITQVVDTNDSARVNSINTSLLIQTARIDDINSSVSLFQPSAYNNISALQSKPDGTGGWTNTTIVTSTGLQVNITGLTQFQTNAFFPVGAGIWWGGTGIFSDGIYKPTSSSMIIRVGSSSTGANRIQINGSTGFVGIGVHENSAVNQRLQVNGSTNITNTTYTNLLTISNNTAASCDLKADTNGNVYCGTDSTGGGGGVNNGITLDAEFNLTNKIGLQNSTLLSCSNITGAASDLCTITSSGGAGDGTGGWTNTTTNTSTNLYVYTTGKMFQYGTNPVRDMNMLFCDFTSSTYAVGACAPDFYGTVAGTGGISAIDTAPLGTRGVFSISRGTAASSGYTWSTHITAFRIGGGEEFSTLMNFTLPTGTNQTRGILGFCDAAIATSGITLCSRGIWFNLTGNLTDGLNVSGMTNNAGTPTTSKTGFYRISPNQLYVFKIRVINQSRANFSIYHPLNGTYLWSEEINSANFPSNTSSGVGARVNVGETLAGTAGVRATIDYIHVEFEQIDSKQFNRFY